GDTAAPRHGRVRFGPGARRGGPGDFDARLARVEHLLAAPGGGGGAAGPLALVASVVRFQAGRAAAPAVVAAAGAVAAGAELRLAAGRFPLLDLAVGITPIAAEIPFAASALEPRGLPEPLMAAGMALAEANGEEREALVEAWLEDPAGPEAVLG